MEQMVFDNEALKEVENAIESVDKGGIDWKSAGIGAAGIVLAELGYKHVVKPVCKKIKKAIQDRKAKKEAAKNNVETSEEIETTEE